MPPIPISEESCNKNQATIGDHLVFSPANSTTTTIQIVYSDFIVIYIKILYSTRDRRDDDVTFLLWRHLTGAHVLVEKKLKLKLKKTYDQMYGTIRHLVSASAASTDNSAIWHSFQNSMCKFCICLV